MDYKAHLNLMAINVTDQSPVIQLLAERVNSTKIFCDFKDIMQFTLLLVHTLNEQKILILRKVHPISQD